MPAARLPAAVEPEAAKLAEVSVVVESAEEPVAAEEPPAEELTAAEAVELPVVVVLEEEPPAAVGRNCEDFDKPL